MTVLGRWRPRADHCGAVALQLSETFITPKITGNSVICWFGPDFPAEHWIHLRTTNPIESTFSTVKLRTKVTRGAGSPAAALAMVFKLVESAQARWRAITGAHLVRLVRAGARFENGVLVERQERAPEQEDEVQNVACLPALPVGCSVQRS